MDASATQYAHSMARSGAELVGRVASVSGSQATIELTGRSSGGEHPTVGKFVGMLTGKGTIIGLVTEIGEQATLASGGPSHRKIARLDLIGEIHTTAEASKFHRGVTDYPSIG